jgi:hypothetical protein
MHINERRSRRDPHLNLLTPSMPRVTLPFVAMPLDRQEGVDPYQTNSANVLTRLQTSAFGTLRKRTNPTLQRLCIRQPQATMRLRTLPISL